MKLVQKKFSKEEREELVAKTMAQTERRGRPKTTDESKYPVFETPAGSKPKKYLVYIPNHTRVNEEGKTELLMDKPFIHVVKEGNSYNSIRCTNGLVLGDAFDGTCPICNARSEEFEGAKAEIKYKLANEGYSEDDTSDAVKNIKRSVYEQMPISQAVRYYTFPICVIDAKQEGRKWVLNKDEDGKISYTAMWFSVTEKKFKDVFEKALENDEDGLDHIGGCLVVLDYSYDLKPGQEPNKRDAGKNLKVYIRTNNFPEEITNAMDEATKEWTPECAMEVLYNNMLYDVEQLTEAMKPFVTQAKQQKAMCEAAMLGQTKPISAPRKEEPKEIPQKTVPLETDLDDELDLGDNLDDLQIG